MKVFLLNGDEKVYSSKAYLVLGNWGKVEDVNTMIDVGTDESILRSLENIYTGVGKKKVDQVVLTHNHYDHTGNLSIIKKLYKPKVYAFSDGDGIDECLKDGQRLHVGDGSVEIIHAPVHSSDSVCLYCREEGILFAGDTPLKILGGGGTYSREFAGILKRLSTFDIRAVYTGHDAACKEGIQEMLARTLKNVNSTGSAQ